MLNFFKNLQVGKKLTLAFLLISIFIGIVGAEGLFDVNKINNNAKNTYFNNIASIKCLEEIK